MLVFRFLFVCVRHICVLDVQRAKNFEAFGELALALPLDQGVCFLCLTVLQLARVFTLNR